jgi:CRISPR-associated exonuclease Cas4
MAEGPVKYISAGDLEKYAYCPLSFLLSLQYDKQRDDTDRGIEEHEKLGKTLWKIDAGERTARESERVVFWWAVAATLCAVVGLEMLPLANAFTMSQILGVVALIWVLAASFFLYKASRSKMDSAVLSYEKLILVFAIVAVVVGVNAVALPLPEVH